LTQNVACTLFYVKATSQLSRAKLSKFVCLHFVAVNTNSKVLDFIPVRTFNCKQIHNERLYWRH
jgi:hypothetical protein